MEEVGQRSLCEELMGVAYGRVLEQGGIDLLTLFVLRWEWRICGICGIWHDSRCGDQPLKELYSIFYSLVANRDAFLPSYL